MSSGFIFGEAWRARRRRGRASRAVRPRRNQLAARTSESPDRRPDCQDANGSPWPPDPEARVSADDVVSKGDNRFVVYEVPELVPEEEVPASQVPRSNWSVCAFVEVAVDPVVVPGNDVVHDQDAVGGLTLTVAPDDDPGSPVPRGVARVHDRVVRDEGAPCVGIDLDGVAVRMVIDQIVRDQMIGSLHVQSVILVPGANRSVVVDSVSDHLHVRRSGVGEDPVIVPVSDFVSGDLDVPRPAAHVHVRVVVAAVGPLHRQAVHADIGDIRELQDVVATSAAARLQDRPFAGIVAERDRRSRRPGPREVQVLAVPPSSHEHPLTR